MTATLPVEPGDPVDLVALPAWGLFSLPAGFPVVERRPSLPAGRRTARLVQGLTDNARTAAGPPFIVAEAGGRAGQAGPPDMD
jgi:hypothetical protein